MYEGLRSEISKAINKNDCDAVLFSGGIDSSVVLYENYLKNSSIAAITISVKGKENSDEKYSKIVSKKIGIKNHLICYVTEAEILKHIEKAILLLKTFNPEWISSTVTLLIAANFARKKGYKKISGGEGADDLFGSFPFFNNWNNKYISLDEVIVKRYNEISTMSDLVVKSVGLDFYSPFKDDNVKKEILNIPIQERIKKNKLITSKYPLRMAYKKILPKESIIRPQTMAFSGSGIFKVISKIADDVTDKEFDDAKEKYFEFKSKLEYALFKIYIKYL